MTLRDYQKKALKEVNAILKKYSVCYLAGEVRTGKTLVALHAANNRKTLFITKKIAISGIESDIKAAGIKNVTVINYEALHQLPDNDYQFLILDEAHCLGQYPKPAKKARQIREWFQSVPTLLLSGTPSPESFSQLYHQFWATGKGPWRAFKTFYKWAQDYVEIKLVNIGSGRTIRSYSTALDTVLHDFQKFRVSMTQKEAKFAGRVLERLHLLPIPDSCRDLIKTLKRDRIVLGRKIADTGASLMSATHQLCSGTLINQTGEREIIDDFKARYIRQTFKGKKIAIFYCYVAEGELLEKYFKTTRDPAEFKKHKDLVFIAQIVSGREGINLSSADELIFFNISYSAVSYWQARARTQSQEGGDKTIHWLFSIKGIELKIYEAVKEKKNFTLHHFRTSGIRNSI